jgi:hypothetical protein
LSLRQPVGCLHGLHALSVPTRIRAGHRLVLAGMIAVLWFAVPLTRRQERRLQRLLEALFTPS